MIEDEATEAIFEQAPPQRPLQQGKPEQRHLVCRSGDASSCHGPVTFNQSDTIDDQPVIGCVGSPMHGQPHDFSSIFARGQQYPVSTKIIETNSSATNDLNEPRKTAHSRDLHRQKMMPLHPGMIAGS